MVRLYLMRQNGDFIIDLFQKESLFTIKVTDTAPGDPFEATSTVGTYRELTTFLDILFQQVFNDLDCPEPFLRFQYNISPFPSVLIPIEKVDDIRYKRFINALHYHFHNSATS